MDELLSLKERIEYHTSVNLMQKDLVRVMVTEKGGRIIAVDFGEGNLLWVNDDIEFNLKNDEWNLGGIRTWISPEQLFFYSDPENFDGWFCQRNLDPADYFFTKQTKTQTSMDSNINIVNMATNEKLIGRINKNFSLGNCLRTASSLKFEIKISTELLLEVCEFPVALWTLVQVPVDRQNKGIVTIPVTENSQPIHYFGQIPADYLQVDKSEIKFIMDGSNELKLGIKPEDLQNPVNQKMKYTFTKNQKRMSLELSSLTGATSQAQCLDKAKANPNGPKGVLQCYNSDCNKSGLAFGELEIQSKPVEKTGEYWKAKEEILITFEMNLD
ncbi:MAG TPA: DUF6786 family protein [Candidatus Bathyarchaeia archaeon]|nr:DUF6786 family protein [Candidatus Bathyarchaeia archaeon]